MKELKRKRKVLLGLQCLGFMFRSLPITNLFNGKQDENYS